jgi:hypothetical protein
MTKIANYVQSIFAGSIPPTNVLSIFGALKAGNNPSSSYSSNIETLQSLAAWDEGLVSAMINLYNPALQDINTLFHVPSNFIAYCKQAGLPEWKANITYYMGSLVSDGLGSIYRSLVDTNLNQPFTDATKWFMVDSIKVTEIAGPYTALNTDYFIRWSTIDTSADPAEKLIKLPMPSASLIGRRYLVRNVSGASYNLTIEAFDGSSIFNGGATDGLGLGNGFVSTYVPFSNLICDGTYWWTLDVNYLAV